MKGKVGHGAKSCGNNTCCSSRTGGGGMRGHPVPYGPQQDPSPHDICSHPLRNPPCVSDMPCKTRPHTRVSQVVDISGTSGVRTTFHWCFITMVRLMDAAHGPCTTGTTDPIHQRSNPAPSPPPSSHHTQVLHRRIEKGVQYYGRQWEGGRLLPLCTSDSTDALVRSHLSGPYSPTDVHSTHSPCPLMIPLPDMGPSSGLAEEQKKKPRQIALTHACSVQRQRTTVSQSLRGPFADISANSLERMQCE